MIKRDLRNITARGKADPRLDKAAVYLISKNLGRFKYELVLGKMKIHCYEKAEIVNREKGRLQNKTHRMILNKEINGCVSVFVYVHKYGISGKIADVP